MRRHTVNVIGLCVSLTLLGFALWQLDWQCAPHEWEVQHMRELLPFWYMWNTHSYVMWIALIMIAFVGQFISLWEWDNTKDSRLRKT